MENPELPDTGEETSEVPGLPSGPLATSREDMGDRAITIIIIIIIMIVLIGACISIFPNQLRAPHYEW